MSAFFLSDLHLPLGPGEGSRRFADLLDQRLGAGDVLILGGDIFDLFVGDKKVFREGHAVAIAALRRAGARGVKTFYLEGNHDFHIAGALAQVPGLEVCVEDFSLDVLGRQIWVSHGDLIDPTDKGYRFLRWLTRTLPLRALVGLLPGAWISGLGRASARQSRKYNSEARMSEEEQRRLRGLYQDFARERVAAGYEHVLVGHSHLLDQVDISAGSRRGEYVNLGYSHDFLRYAELGAGGTRFELKRFP
jgi:UDP-2,3-diacylglucosamine hydrolase